MRRGQAAPIAATSSMEPEEYERLALVEQRHWWYVGMQLIAEALLPHAAEYPAGAHRPRILDAGCGTGGALSWLSPYGALTGVDIHWQAARHAADVKNRVAQASVQQLPFACATFDGVTSFDVIYHESVTDDVQALCEFSRVLRPGGWLLIRVPAHNWLRGAHDRQVHTRQRYGRSELVRKIETAGLNLERMTSAGLLLLPVAVVYRTLQRRNTATSDVQQPGKRVNAALLAMLRVEAWWLRRHELPAGLSLLALARKPAHQ
jgi:SAM-dependent methyltransferase